MSDFQEQFKEFILNDIFWFDKSEVNFGIYKIFRQKEKLIKDKLDSIVENIQSSLTQDNADSIETLKNTLLDDYIPGRKAKDLSLDSLEDIEEAIKQFGNGDTESLLNQLDTLKTEDKYDATKVYEYLYQFFHLYYEKGDFGYTPRSFRTYTLPYHHEEHLLDDTHKCTTQSSSDAMYAGEETMFTWKTKDSYYIKSSKLLNSVVLNLDYEGETFAIHTQVIEKDDDIKDDKKVKQYRLVSITKEAGNKIFLRFNISDHPAPKHTVYALMLAVMKGDIDAVDYDAITQDKAAKEYLETLPFADKALNASLLDNSINKIAEAFAEIMQDEGVAKYLWKPKPTEKNPKGHESFFKYKLTGEEDKAQIKAKVSKLMLSKKEYAAKLYTKTTAKAALDASSFDFDNKNKLEALYKHDAMLNFFYRLDRGVNLFYAGVDSDYFIHKNLKRFLNVELDKFIKNYIFVDTDALLRMDESAKQVALFARIFKEQAQTFIDILATIEEFQKYLWNKRKMVKSSHYVVSSNIVKNDALLEEVLNNQDQVNEWIKPDNEANKEALGLIDKKPTLGELKQASFPIDTKHFDTTFKFALLSQFDDIEEALSGLLIKSENYQALRFLEPKYKEKIKCIYIDPPYNTGNDGFAYKDSYKEASWLSMMQDRLEMARELMQGDGIASIHINKQSEVLLSIISDDLFGIDNNLGTVIWNKGNPKGDSNAIAYQHESILNYCRNSDELKELEQVKRNAPAMLRKAESLFKKVGKTILPPSVKKALKILGIEPRNEHKVLYTLENAQNDFQDWLETQPLSGGEKAYKYISKDGRVFQSVSMAWPNKKKAPDEYFIPLIHPETKKPCPVPDRGWRNPPSTMQELLDSDLILFGEDETTQPRRIYFLDENMTENIPSVIYDGSSDDTLFKNMSFTFDNPKPVSFSKKYISSILGDDNGFVMDYFAGSGTTAHATIDLNRSDNGKRKFIVVEMNDYFETIILPRVKKVNFSSEWKDGKAQNQDGYGGIFQYVELEQYDDIIDDLQVADADYSKVNTRYIYEPDKNQVNFRMDDELKSPLSESGHFDILHSLLFHQGLTLNRVLLESDVLIAWCTNRQGKTCAIVLSGDKDKAKASVEGLGSDYAEIFANVRTHNATRIVADLFKG